MNLQNSQFLKECNFYKNALKFFSFFHNSESNCSITLGMKRFCPFFQTIYHKIYLNNDEFKIIPKTFHIFQYKNRFQNLKTGFFFFFCRFSTLKSTKEKKNLVCYKTRYLYIYIYQITIVHRLDI